MIMAVVVEEKRLGAWGPKKLGEFFSSIKLDWDIGERIIIKQGYLMNFFKGEEFILPVLEWIRRVLGVSVKPSKGNKKFVHSRLMVAGPDIVAFRSIKTWWIIYPCWG